MTQILVDDEDAWRLSEQRWGLQVIRTKHRVYHYARRFETRSGKRRIRYLHREITGAQPGQVVDHINGNTLDNRRSNLRVCAHAENMRNRNVNAASATGVKGVRWSSGKSKYRASVVFEGKEYHCGYADTIEAAAVMYNARAAELHKQFHRPAETAAVTA